MKKYWLAVKLKSQIFFFNDMLKIVCLEIYSIFWSEDFSGKQRRIEISVPEL